VYGITAWTGSGPPWPRADRWRAKINGQSKGKEIDKMNKINEYYKIITDKDLKNPLCEYFNVNDIVFNFIPDNIEVPIIDQILYQCNDKEKILLIVNFSTLVKLCEQHSKYHNFIDLVNSGKIRLIYFQPEDSLLHLVNTINGKNIKLANILKDLKFIWWTDSMVGGYLIKQFKNAQLYELHHPNLVYVNTHHFFHLKKEKKKTNTFLSLMRLHSGTGRKHRNILAEKMQDKVYLKSSIANTNLARGSEKQELLFSDLEAEYGKIHLQNGHVWSDGLPVISLYERTYFELLTETFGAVDGDDSFFLTEKTLKPIVMGHPFIVLSTKHFLKNLRGLGFRTFGDFVDESYDECDTIAERVEIISKNLERLDMAASEKFYEDTQEIRDHNQRHLLYLHGRYKFDLWGKWNNFFKNLE